MDNRFYVQLSTLISQFVLDLALVAAIVNYFDINVVYHTGVTSSLLSTDKALVFLQPSDNVSGKPWPPTFLHMSSGKKMCMVTLVPWTPCVDNTHTRCYFLFPLQRFQMCFDTNKANLYQLTRPLFRTNMSYFCLSWIWLTPWRKCPPRFNITFLSYQLITKPLNRTKQTLKHSALSSRVKLTHEHFKGLLVKKKKKKLELKFHFFF